MGIIDNRLSTTPVTNDWLPPDDRNRVNWLEDYEAGPIALNDPSEGLSYQPWHMVYNPSTDDFVVTPETVGSPTTVLNVADVDQCTFTFDQNGHVTIAYQVGSDAYLYWYDTLAADWVTDLLDTGVTWPSVYMDDKRETQNDANDILLMYTIQQIDDSWNLYYRQQRDRFTIEYLLKEGCQPYLYKTGMHYGLRGQIALLSSIGGITVETFGVVNSGNNVVNSGIDVVATF